MLADRPLRALLDSFAASTATPAGGSASALASALGASLLLMAARLVRADARSSATDTIARTLADVQQRLTEAIDADADAYQRVIADRSNANAMKDATEVPLHVMQWSLRALETSASVAASCRRSTKSDVRVGIELLAAGFSGARSSVQANLSVIGDQAYVEQAANEIAGLERSAAVAIEAARNALVR